MFVTESYFSQSLKKRLLCHHKKTFTVLYLRKDLQNKWKHFTSVGSTIQKCRDNSQSHSSVAVMLKYMLNFKQID